MHAGWVHPQLEQAPHQADVIALKGDCYRLKNHDLGRIPAAITTE